MAIKELDFFCKNPDLVEMLRKKPWEYKFVVNLMGEYDWGKISEWDDLTDGRQTYLTEIYQKWKDKAPTRF